MPSLPSLASPSLGLLPYLPFRSTRYLLCFIQCLVRFCAHFLLSAYQSTSSSYTSEGRICIYIYVLRGERKGGSNQGGRGRGGEEGRGGGRGSEGSVGEQWMHGRVLATHWEQTPQALTRYRIHAGEGGVSEQGDDG